MAPHSSSLAWKIHGQRSLVDCSPWGGEESDTTEWLPFHFPLSCIGEGNGNPLQCSCLENPRDGGAWWAAVYGVAESRTRLKRLSSSSSIKTSWASLVAQTVKNLLTMWKTQLPSLGQEDALEKGMATHPSILAWRIPWPEELGGLQSLESQRVRHDWVTKTHTHTHTHTHKDFLYLMALNIDPLNGIILEQQWLIDRDIPFPNAALQQCTSTAHSCLPSEPKSNFLSMTFSCVSCKDSSEEHFSSSCKKKSFWTFSLGI